MIYRSARGLGEPVVLLPLFILCNIVRILTILPYRQSNEPRILNEESQLRPREVTA